MAFQTQIITLKRFYHLRLFIDVLEEVRGPKNPELLLRP